MLLRSLEFLTENPIPKGPIQNRDYVSWSMCGAIGALLWSNWSMCGAIGALLWSNWSTFVEQLEHNFNDLLAFIIYRNSGI